MLPMSLVGFLLLGPSPAAPLAPGGAPTTDNLPALTARVLENAQRRLRVRSAQSVHHERENGGVILEWGNDGKAQLHCKGHIFFVHDRANTSVAPQDTQTRPDAPRAK
jgi:hypothetical protein